MEENEELLRLYIDKLETWPEDAPPSAAEIRELNNQIRLSESDRDKLELLAENHILRATTAFNAGSYEQAAAELVRAAQLKPLDPLPRIELAEVYLQRSLDRGYGRKDRQKAIKLAQSALQLSPGDQRARDFLNEYRRMNADFRNAKNRRFIIPVAIATILLGLTFWWQKDWVISRLQSNSGEFIETAISVPVDGDLPAERTVPLSAEVLSQSGLTTQITSSSVGRRNDASFVSLRGRLKSEGTELGDLTVELRARDESGTLVFTIPWVIRDKQSPRLIPGDTQALSLFRWIANSEEAISSLEIVPTNIETSLEQAGGNSMRAELVWATPRPESTSLSAEVREKRIIEAYDRQVLLMDIAIENTGSVELSYLEAGVSVGSQFDQYTLNAINENLPPMISSERRVWPVAMSLPLDAQDIGNQVTIRILKASR